jgi:hypothetical protein
MERPVFLLPFIHRTLLIRPLPPIPTDEIDSERVLQINLLERFYSIVPVFDIV